MFPQEAAGHRYAGFGRLLVATLAGGQQRLVALALCLLLEPLERLQTTFIRHARERDREKSDVSDEFGGRVFVTFPAYVLSMPSAAASGSLSTSPSAVSSYPTYSRNLRSSPGQPNPARSLQAPSGRPGGGECLSGVAMRRASRSATS